MGLQKRQIGESFFGKKHRKIAHGQNFAHKIIIVAMMDEGPKSKFPIKSRKNLNKFDFYFSYFVELCLCIYDL